MDDYHSKIPKQGLKKYKVLLQEEVNKLLLNEWEFLNENWQQIHEAYKHRTELKHIKEIEETKKKLLDKLDYTAVFFFLTKLYTHKKYLVHILQLKKDYI